MNRSHALTTACAVGALLVTVGCFATSADAAGPPSGTVPPGTDHQGAVASAVPPAKSHGNCYSNMKHDSGIAIVSQDFTDSGFDMYDSSGAVPFRVKRPCVVETVVVPGEYFNGSGPADSETVTFYADDAGAPGAVIDSQTVVGNDDNGSFTIPLDPVKIPAGPAWVGVVATMAFSAGGEWGWELSLNARGHVDALWENPGDGFGTGCATWSDVYQCLDYGNSFMVQLVKQYQRS